VKETIMNAKTLRALIALNVALLVGLLLTVMTPRPAMAQLARAEYIMVAGAVTGRTQQNAVYVVDLSSARIVAFMFNGSNKQLEIVGAAELGR
jgi:hypothetical protein